MHAKPRARHHHVYLSRLEGLPVLTMYGPSQVGPVFSMSAALLTSFFLKTWSRGLNDIGLEPQRRGGSPPRGKQISLRPPGRPRYGNRPSSTFSYSS
ncbi:hypothetical protein Tco_1169337 [Tanacetum coccineum]